MQAGDAFMSLSHLLGFLTLSLWLGSTALAAEGSVTISSPDNGAVLNARADNVISYDVKLAPGGDHAHLYVDGREVAILRKLKGSYTIVPPEPGIMSYDLPVLVPGVRSICIKQVNKNHTPIGISQCIKVTVR